MKKVIFYLIEDTDNNRQSWDNTQNLLSHEVLACEKAAEIWNQYKTRILIACQSQAQAEKVDEFLWQLDTANFVPHNMAGEGPRGGAPVEICWPEKRGSGARQLLINLQNEFADFSLLFQDVIDFVPLDDELKLLARERYKAYKNVGFNLKTIPYTRS